MFNDYEMRDQTVTNGCPSLPCRVNWMYPFQYQKSICVCLFWCAFQFMLSS